MANAVIEGHQGEQVADVAEEAAEEATEEENA